MMEDEDRLVREPDIRFVCERYPFLKDIYEYFKSSEFSVCPIYRCRGEVQLLLRVEKGDWCIEIPFSQYVDCKERDYFVKEWINFLIRAMRAKSVTPMEF
jgi:hypothetical protein